MNTRIYAKINGLGMDEDEIFPSILSSRGIEDPQDFLYPTEDDMIPYTDMKNIDKAFEVIDEACTFGDSIIILADPDTDGATSASLLCKYLDSCGADVGVTISEEKKHGTRGIDLEFLKEYDVIIIVDSIDDTDVAYKELTDAGKKVIIFDHHIPSEEILNSDSPFILVSSAVDYDNPQLSGAGVVMKYCLYSDEMNGTRYAENLWYLAAIGIVADMSDMSYPENRYIVSKGLAQYENETVKKFVGTYPFDSTSISYSIAPMINAAMRTGNNEQALQVFLTEDDEKRDETFATLKECKTEQNNVIDKLMPEIERQVSEQENYLCNFVFIPQEYKSLSGLIANSVMSNTKKPIFVLYEDGENWAGSMRSSGYGSMLDIANSTKLCNCAGHEEASGVFILDENIEEFVDTLNEKLSTMERHVDIGADIMLTPDQVTDSLVKKLFAFNRLSGNGCPPIRIMMKLNDYEVGYMSNGKHTKITDKESGMLFIKWNSTDWTQLTGEGMFSAVGTVGFARYGKKSYTQMIMDGYVIENLQMWA